MLSLSHTLQSTVVHRLASLHFVVQRKRQRSATAKQRYAMLPDLACLAEWGSGSGTLYLSHERKETEYYFFFFTNVITLLQW